MSWKKVAQASILGEKVNLQSIVPDKETIEKWANEGRESWKDYFFVPKQYSIGEKDKIDAFIF